MFILFYCLTMASGDLNYYVKSCRAIKPLSKTSCLELRDTLNSTGSVKAYCIER